MELKYERTGKASRDKRGSPYFSFLIPHSSLLILSFFLQLSRINAQSPSNQMQYLINPSVLSPCLFDNKIRFSGILTYRSEWSGFQGRPVSALLDVSGTVKGNMFFGGEIRFQASMVFRSFFLALKYAYQIRIQEEQYLTLGVNATIYQNILDLTQATVLDPADPLLQGKERITQTSLNIGAGLAYRFKTFIISFYAPLLLNNSSSYDRAVEGSLSLPRNLQAYISNDFLINREWMIKPVMRVNVITGLPTIFEVSILSEKIEQFWFAAQFRSSMILGFTVGGQLWKHLVLSYGYEFYTGNKPGASTGTHEITIGYRIGSARIITPELKDYFSALQIRKQ